MMADNHILIADDEPLTRQSLYEILKFEGYRVTTAKDGLEALGLIEKLLPEIVISDMKMPGMEGLQLVKEMKARGLEIPVILITGYGSIEAAVEAMREGAFDYVTKPIVDSEIKVVIEKILKQQKLIEENRCLREALKDTTRKSFQNIVGQDPQMQKIYALIEMVADSNATILLHGESGTGKSLIAYAIHQSDTARRDKPLVEVSCGALPETLLETELFGHVRGAFTGAIKDRTGRFELAEKGSIFLDEIDAFSPNLQVKLLRILQSGEFERVGDTKTVKVDVRVIAATNQDLSEAIKKGKFREDLYYRLNVISIKIPPLRERRNDIPLLLEYFLEKKNNEVNKNNKKVTGISKEAMLALLQYNWPGNVRELENIVERSVILARGNIVGIQDLPEFFHKTDIPYKEAMLTGISGRPHAKSLRQALKSPERQVIQDALEQAGGNRKDTAARLGINRTTLYNKMKEYGLLKRRTAVKESE